MNPDSNKFEAVFKDGELKISEENAEKESERKLGCSLEYLKSQLSGAGNLVRSDGSPVPSHWPILKNGEIVTVKNYGFKVAHIGESHLLLEPTGPLTVGEGHYENPMSFELDKARERATEACHVLIDEIGSSGPESIVETAKRAVSELAWRKKLADERLGRCRILWNTLCYLITETERLVGRVKGHSKASVVLDDVLRIAKYVKGGGPLGHQGDLEEGVDELSLTDLERASGAIKNKK